MMKKLMATGAAAAVFLSAAVPAFAGCPGCRPPRPQDTVTVNLMGTNVSANTLTAANTGMNLASGSVWMKGPCGRPMPVRSHVTTGAAVAGADVYQQANTVTVGGCNCFDDVNVNAFGTNVRANTLTVANSGLNMVHGGDVTTGRAQAGSLVQQVVNTVTVGM